MSLKEKYADVGALGTKLGVRDGHFDEADGKLRMGGIASYKYDVDRIWDAIKAHDGWETEVEASITFDCKDCYGIYEVSSGDTLGGIAKEYFGNVGDYPRLHEANRDVISDPNVIQVGWKLKLPWRDGEAPAG